MVTIFEVHERFGAEQGCCSNNSEEEGLKWRHFKYLDDTFLELKCIVVTDSGWLHQHCVHLPKPMNIASLNPQSLTFSLLRAMKMCRKLGQNAPIPDGGVMR